MIFLSLEKLKHLMYVFLAVITVPLACFKCRLWEGSCRYEWIRELRVWWVLCIFKVFPSKLWHGNKFCCSWRSITSFSAPATILMHLFPMKNNRNGYLHAAGKLWIEDVCLWRAGYIAGRPTLCDWDNFWRKRRGEVWLVSLAWRGVMGIISAAGPWLLPALHCSVGALPAGGNTVWFQGLFSGCSL